MKCDGDAMCKVHDCHPNNFWPIIGNCYRKKMEREGGVVAMTR